MSFISENGEVSMNDEQKVRFTLSNRAKIIMTEDMDVFGVNKASTFINTVFDNYKNEAKSSISLYLQQRSLDIDRQFSNTKLDSVSKKIAIEQLLLSEKEDILNIISSYKNTKGESKLYHINNKNTDYLKYDCEEDEYYKHPGQYIHSVVEEYCSLPFIKRERIYRKDIYDIVEQACKEKRVLKVKANHLGKDTLFYVYPYKIVPDPFHTQSYLVCYSRKAEESDSDKIVASFSMARIEKPTMLLKTFHLNKKEISNIEYQLTYHSPAYLVGKPEQIEVKLTERGKQTYQAKLFSRPEKIESLSNEDVYVFNCTPLQAYNYFFSFGADAEIISPESLRNRFKNNLTKALEIYK